MTTQITIPELTSSARNTHTLALYEARSILKDHDAPLRYADTDLIQFINEFYLEIDRLRPDLTYDLRKNNIIPTNYIALDDLGESKYQFQPNTFIALSEYIAARALMRDEQYANANVAQALLAQALARFMG